MFACRHRKKAQILKISPLWVAPVLDEEYGAIVIQTEYDEASGETVRRGYSSSNSRASS